MRSRTIVAGLAAAILAISTPAMAQAPEPALAPAGPLKPGQAIPPAELAAFVDAAVADAMATDHILGASVAVVQDGRVVLLKGYGVTGPGRDRQVDPQRTLFRIASISKTFTWTLLMKEVEKGRIKLDDPVNDYLPERLKIPDQGFKKPIRFVDLMSHSAGFEDSAFGHLFVDNGDKVTSLEDYLARHRPNRVREPGVSAAYSNYGAGLAGYIVARLNGVDFETLVEREITGPLAMTSTTFREPYAPRAGLPKPIAPELAARISPGYMFKGGDFAPAPFEFVNQVAPGGGGTTTAADMSRYMLMRLNGGRLDDVQIYGPASAQAFRTPILKVPDQVNGWAHGLMMRPMPGGFQSYGHGGSLISFYSNLVMIPDLNLGVFVTTNTNTGRPFTDRLPKLLVERFYGPGAPFRLSGDPALVRDAAKYEGGYVPTRRPYSGLESFIYLLTNDDSVKVTSRGYLITDVGGQSQAWVPAGEPGQFRAIDSEQRMRFELDGKGRATSFLFARGNATMERATFIQSLNTLMASAALALVAALATWIGAFTRIGRDVRPTVWQAWANALSLATAAAWLISFVTFALKLSKASAPDLMFNWPGSLLLTASWAALLATVGTALLALTAPMTWRDGVEGGWSLWRKARHSLAILVFALFAIVVGLRGGLIPWA